MTEPAPNLGPRAREISDAIQAAEYRVIPLDELAEWEKNPRRRMDEGSDRLATTIGALGVWGADVLVQKSTGRIIGGHLRKLAAAKLGLEAVPCKVLDVDDALADAIALADNRASEFAEWDPEPLAELLEDFDPTLRAEMGWSDADLDALLEDLEGDGGEVPKTEGPPLKDRFVVPPFSVLDTRRGYWQERRQAWMSLGLRSEEGRGGGLLGFPLTGLVVDYYEQKRAAEKKTGRELTRQEFERDFLEIPEGSSMAATGTSVFDPVVCEIAYRWFSPPDGLVLDPFAGGSVRGVLASKLGRRYVGIELREEQVEANRAQARAICVDAVEPVEKLDPVEDPEALTPVQRAGDVWMKRDDLFTFAGAFGSKARAGRAIAAVSSGLCVAGSRNAPMISRVARIGEEAGIPVRCHVAGSKKLSDQERDAVGHGAELVKHSVNYLRTLVSKSRADAEERGWTHIELGLESDLYFEVNEPQAANVPAEAKRVVVAVGSGTGLACVLRGLEKAGRSDLPVLGVCVGFDPTKLLDRRAPADWRDRVTLVKATQDFGQRAAVTTFAGVDLDPHYEAKLLPFLRAGDCVYLLAKRTVDHEAAPAPDEMKAWQKGIPLDELRAVAALFKAHDDGLTQGAFTGVKETDVARAWAAGKLYVVRDDDGAPRVAIIASKARSKRKVEDFTGARRAQIQKGDVHVRRFAFREDSALSCVDALGELVGPEATAWIEAWIEHPGDRDVVEALGAELAAVKIRASSEQVGVFKLGGLDRKVRDLDAADVPALARLPLAVSTTDVDELVAALEREEAAFADHYSGYNKRHTWAACVLRGYGGRADFIIKPAEMSKKWKAANAEKLGWELEDTPLRAKLPEVEALLEEIPGEKHRIRVMRLSAKEGELTRHADITDPDAGTADGKLLRIHFPLVTNEEVLFESWRIDGAREEARMRVGEAWYLDTRKPHRARNAGATDRLHLVVDVEGTAEIRELLARADRPGDGLGLVEPIRQAGEVTGLPFAGELAPEPLQTEKEGPTSPAFEPAPRWIHGDSRKLHELLEDEAFDFLFSCPPYGDLEVYSDDPADLSTLEWEDFLDAYREIVAKSVARLRNDRFACFVVGDLRDGGTGLYRNFVSETIRAFEDAGARLYNEAILVSTPGALPIRAGRIFEASRKLGKNHQNVLVFVKGDWRRACAAARLDFDAEDLARTIE